MNFETPYVINSWILKPHTLLILKLNNPTVNNTHAKHKVLGASAGHYASSAYALLVVVQQVALILI